jgi:hypothetical protein
VVRGREEEGDVSGGLDAFVAMELGAVVDGDGTGRSSGGIDEANGRPVDGFDGAAVQLADPCEAGPAIDEGQEAVAVGAEDGVTFEVSDARAVLGTGRPLGEVVSSRRAFLGGGPAGLLSWWESGSGNARLTRHDPRSAPSPRSKKTLGAIVTTGFGGGRLDIAG